MHALLFLSLVQFFIVLDVPVLLRGGVMQVLEQICCPFAVTAAGLPITRLLVWLVGSLEKVLSLLPSPLFLHAKAS